MKFLQELFHGKGYIDGITIINLEGEILFTAKFNNKLGQDQGSEELVGKNFLDVYENLTPQTSTTIKAMERGTPAYVENQFLKTRGRDGITITSLSIPIKCGGRIVGAIDLSTQEPGVRPEATEGLLQVDVSGYFHGDARKMAMRDAAVFTLDDLIAEDAAMKRVRDYIPVAASCDLPVMIYGETGTGKEVVAQAIHNASRRSAKPFIAQNCAALPDQLQSKLLRVLQDGRFRSLGGRRTKCVDVKVIAAINVDPLQAIRSGQLRQDIYYRLSMMSIRIPPLRERRADIRPFINLYVNKHNATFHKHIQYISRELAEWMEAYDWPGNVRELEHRIVSAMSRVEPSSQVLGLEDLEELPASGAQPPFPLAEEGARPESPPPLRPLRQAVREYERGLIQRALEAAGGNVSRAAQLLEIPRQTLCRRIQEYGLRSGGRRSS